VELDLDGDNGVVSVMVPRMVRQRRIVGVIAWRTLRVNKSPMLFVFCVPFFFYASNKGGGRPQQKRSVLKKRRCVVRWLQVADRPFRRTEIIAYDIFNLIL